ncbi:MAG: DNA-protecting protein DprA [Cellvibrionales bacterium]|nr:DNA-protecting protein DprA [Cellvibrionales bacterium]
MNLGAQAQATLLLTVSLGKAETKPLSVREWGRLALWLKDHRLGPGRLLAGDLRSLLAGWMDRTVSLQRIEELLGRGGALGLALEKWQRAGLWVMTRAEPDYPDRLKGRLRLACPPVLFGCGNKALLGGGGIAVVGSRDVGDDDLRFTSRLACAAAEQGLSVVSGGARGVDERAMLGALQGEGTAIGVMGDGLLRAATSAKYRQHLSGGNLVLISPFAPEAGFNIGNAMARNKYIYCLADAAVVVHSTLDKGGTWNGAVENLEGDWVPLWVPPRTAAGGGNAALVQRGGRWLSSDQSVFGDLRKLASVAGVVSGRAGRRCKMEERVADAPSLSRADENGVKTAGDSYPMFP